AGRLLPKKHRGHANQRAVAAVEYRRQFVNTPVPPGWKGFASPCRKVIGEISELREIGEAVGRFYIVASDHRALETNSATKPHFVFGVRRSGERQDCNRGE